MVTSGAFGARGGRGFAVWAAVVGLAVAGCVVPPAAVQGPCPVGWTAAVLWSSETAGSSEVVFVGESGELDRRTLPYQGLEPAPVNPTRGQGSEMLLVANGNTVHDRADVLRYSTTSCSYQGFSLKEQLVRGVAPSPDGFYAVSNLNRVTYVRHRDARGGVVAEGQVPGVIVSAMVASSGRLLGIGMDLDANDQGVLVELDPESLAVRRKVALNDDQGAGLAPMVRGDSFYYPRTVSVEGEGRSLGVVSLTDYSQREIDLKSPAPFILVDGGQYLYVAHTFMNPGFRPMAEYRFVSRVNVATEAVETFDVGGPLLGVQVSGSSLLVLTGDLEQPVTLTTYDQATMTKQGSVQIARPSKPGYFYSAGFFVP